MSTLGKRGEDVAANYYRNLGYKILERNFIFPHGKQMGEIDLIVEKDGDLVFVEVKTRGSSKFGGAFESVNQFKQRRLVKTAKLYINLHPRWASKNYRIDVAAIDVDNKNEPVIILTNAVEDYD